MLISAYGVGISIAYSFGYSIIIAFSTSLSKILNKMHKADEHVKLGIMLQRCQIILFCYLFALFFVMFYSKHILVSFGTDLEVAENAQIFVRYCLIGLVFRMFFETSKVYLHAHQIYHVTFIASFICFFFYPMYVNVTVFQYGMGVKGLVIIL